MLLNSKTYNKQSALANYCRGGDSSILKEVNLERASHYRRLVFNVIWDSLSSAYPLTHQLLGEEQWDKLVDNFFSSHKCTSPQVWNMPKELVEYVEESDLDIKCKYPFLTELLYFEWIEIEYFMQPDKTVLVDSASDSGGVIVLNPESGLFHFTYPVHLKNALMIKDIDKGDYYLSIHRHPQSRKVMFTNLSPALAVLVAKLKDCLMTKSELIHAVLSQLNLAMNKDFKKQISDFLDNSIRSGLILGYKN